MTETIKIATRGSRLALWQANFVRAQLAELGMAAELLVLKTQGDRVQHLGFDKLEGKGFFTKEIEDALLDGRAHVAVHSLKDLPTEQPAGLTLGALSYRASVGDLIIARKSITTKGQPFYLPAGATIGTGSNRRIALLRDIHPTLKTVPIRGNVPTRLARVAEGDLDAVVLAAAGLERLEMDLSGYHVVRPSPREFVPAPGQAVMAVQCREENIELRKKLARLHHAEVGYCTNVERQLLQLLGGGCSLPLGVYCETDQLGNYHAWAAYAPDVDSPMRRVQVSQSTYAGLAEALADRLQ